MDLYEVGGGGGGRGMAVADHWAAVLSAVPTLYELKVEVWKIN